MNPKRALVLVTLGIAAASVVNAGCTSQPGAGTIASAASLPVTSAAASPLPESQIPTLGLATLEPSTQPMATPADTPMPEPAAASLAVDGGDPVVGELGSFAWDNSGSDSPWLPGSPMRIGRGERLSLALASDVRIANWTVARSPGATFGSGIVGMGEGTGEPVTFNAPPRGTWSVNVNVWFKDNLGSASYYWLITVT